MAQAKEDARGASLAVSSKRDEVAYRVASLYLDAERAVRIGALARKDTGSQEKVLETVRAQVGEGRALPLAEKTAALAVAGFLRAETHPMTLRQAAEAAMKQSPGILLAHLDEAKARAAVRIARQPFVPRVVVGSGMAYSYGFPMSIEGSAPSIVQANAS